MTSIHKSDNTKNGIILKEVGKKFEEATSTSGCDLEMSEITSSMPNSLSLNIDNCTNVATGAQVSVIGDIIEENVKYVKITKEVSSDIEDVIDGFSVFSFVTEEELIKFSIKNEKIETLSESENNKCKKITKSKKQIKFNKNTKELSCTEDSIDIYDFQGNSESSPSSKNSSVNFKKTLSKKFSTKYIKKFKHKFKAESNMSPSGEENSSSTSVTESHSNLIAVDGRNESPRPTSNDDNNVVSTTTPDNVNIKLEKSEMLSSIDKIQSLTSLRSPLKTVALRLYKFEDELTSSNHIVTNENNSELNVEQQLSTFYSSGTDNQKVYNNQNQIQSNDEKYQPKIVPTTFSVDLLTKISDKQTSIEESNKCVSGSPVTIFDWNIARKSQSLESNNNNQPASNSIIKHTAFDAVVVTNSNFHHSISKMTTSAVKPMILSNGNASVASYKDNNSNGSSADLRTVMNIDNHGIINDDECNIEKTVNKSSTNSPMQSWLELHTKGLLYQQQNGPSVSTIQNNSNAPNVPQKSTNNISSFNSFNSSSHNILSNNNSNINSGTSNKSQHESALLDWKNSYLDTSKLISNSVPKFNQNYNSLSHELANNIRYQQEQQELMNALRIKHENSKIPKPLVHMGLDSIYKADHSSYKNHESRFQTPSVHNYFMPNSQLPTEFNTANVFKTRSDPRCHQNSVDGSSSKESFSKTLTSLSSSNFKAPETLKRRGQWCDMHVKIAYFIYRSQRRMNMLKSQELNSQLSHLMYSQKVPSTGPLPAASSYPSSYLQHSAPYLDYRSSQIKPDASSYMNYQTKSSNAFLNSPIRPINPYHSLIPQNIDGEMLQNGNNNSHEDHQQSPEQKWLRLLSQYMTNHPLSTVDRPNPEILNQLYIWYQQLAQSNPTNHTTNTNPLSQHFTPPSAPMSSSNLDPNSVYLRKYMEHLSSLGSMKPDSANYLNNNLTEREMQMYAIKQQQQQYQKALMSKYQTGAPYKSSAMNHLNPLLLNGTTNPSFYNKKLLEMKSVGADTGSLLPQYSDCVQSLVNQKYRLSQDQIRQASLSSNHHHSSRNGFSKMNPDAMNPTKRRKMNSESVKVDLTQNCDKDEVTDLTLDYVNNNNNNNNNNNSSNNNMNMENKTAVTSKSRDNINFQLQAMIPDTKE